MNADARNVHVRPRQPADELFEEEPRVDRPAIPILRDVREIGDVALEVGAIVAHERQLPEPLAALLAGRDERGDQRRGRSP